MSRDLGEAGPAEQVLDADQRADLALHVAGDERRQPGHARPWPRLAQGEDASAVVGCRVAGLIEGKVDDEAPATVLRRLEHLVAELGAVAHVAVDDLHHAPAAAPDDGVREIEGTVVADTELGEQQPAHEEALGTGVVDVRDPLQDAGQVDPDELEAHGRVVLVADLQLGHLGRPVPQPADDDPDLLPGDHARDRAVVQRRETPCGEALQRADVRGQRGQEQRLGEAVVAAEGGPLLVVDLGPAGRLVVGDAVLLEQHRPQRVVVERTGLLELRLELGGEGLVGTVRDGVVEIAERDDLSEAELVAALHEDGAHQLQRRALALQRRGHLDQSGHEGRAERVGPAEAGGVAVGEEHVARRPGQALGARERLVDLRLGLVVARGEDALLGDRLEVAVGEVDAGEAAVPVGELVLEGQRLRPGPVLADQLAQVSLARDEADDRQTATRVGRLDELGDLLGLAPDEVVVADLAGEPEHELVEEEDEPVVAERLRVPADRG